MEAGRGIGGAAARAWAAARPGRMGAGRSGVAGAAVMTGRRMARCSGEGERTNGFAAPSCPEDENGWFQRLLRWHWRLKLPAMKLFLAELALTTLALTAIIAARYLLASGLAFWLLWQRGGEKLRAR